MNKIAFRLAVNAIAIAITAALLPGITVVNNDIGTYIILAAVIAVVNAIIRPVVTLLTLPITCLTLGIFLLIVNGAMLAIVAALLPGRLTIDTFGWAIGGGLIMAILNPILESILDDFFGVGEKEQKMTIKMR